MSLAGRPSRKRAADLQAGSCPECGARVTINRRVHSSAVHDCATGKWFATPRPRGKR